MVRNQPDDTYKALEQREPPLAIVAARGRTEGWWLDATRNMVSFHGSLPDLTSCPVPSGLRVDCRGNSRPGVEVEGSPAGWRGETWGDVG